MNLAEPQEVLPFTIFGSARYRSSNSEHHRREPVTAELWNTADWEEWAGGFRTGAWVHGNVNRLRTSGRRRIASSSSPICGVWRQLPGYGRSLRPVQKRGIARAFLARGPARECRRRN